MAEDYIKRSDALRVLCEACGNCACPAEKIPRCSYYKKMQSVPAADVVKVERGIWVRTSGMMPPEAFGVYECSICGMTQDYHIPARLRRKTPFCPWCGAKLNGEEVNNGHTD